MNRQKLALLFKLQEMPMAPDVKLAEAVGVSPPTAKVWLEGLKSEQVYVGVQANLNARKLGLQVYDYLVETSSHDSLLAIERFCDLHPYTIYRARVYGGGTHGILVQFRQPPESHRFLQRAFGVFQDKNLIKSVRELPTLLPDYCSIYTRPRLEAWEPETLTWKFDWEQWWKDNSSTTQSHVEVKRTEPVETFQLDALDAKILEIITRDARQKNIQIIEKLGLDKNAVGVQQMVSKRLKRLQEVVDSYSVFVNWTHFDVYNTSMVVAHASPDVTEHLHAKLSNGQFPFGSSMRKTPNGFVWSTRLPSAHLSELITLVWKISSDFEMLTIDYKHSQRYGLWAETFNEKTGSWKSDEEFILTNPLKKLKLL